MCGEGGGGWRPKKSCMDPRHRLFMLQQCGQSYVSWINEKQQWRNMQQYGGGGANNLSALPRGHGTRISLHLIFLPPTQYYFEI